MSPLEHFLSMLETGSVTVASGVVTHFLATVIGLLALMFLVLLYFAHKHEALDWTDILRSAGSNKVSLTKLLQLLGGVTATWMMVYMTIKGTVSSSFFFTYLAYVGAINGWSKFVAMRFGANKSDSAPAPRIPDIK